VGVCRLRRGLAALDSSGNNPQDEATIYWSDCIIHSGPDSLLIANKLGKVIRSVAVFAHRNNRLSISRTLGKLETSFIASGSRKETFFEILSNLTLEELNNVTTRDVKFIMKTETLWGIQTCQETRGMTNRTNLTHSAQPAVWPYRSLSSCCLDSRQNWRESVLSFVYIKHLANIISRAQDAFRNANRPDGNASVTLNYIPTPSNFTLSTDLRKYFYRCTVHFEDSLIIT
jgi:hypothetical protein